MVRVVLAAGRASHPQDGTAFDRDPRDRRGRNRAADHRSVGLALVPTLTYRPATLDAAELASDLMSAAYPAMMHDPKVLRYRWKYPRAGFASERFIAERDGGAIGFLSA